MPGVHRRIATAVISTVLFTASCSTLTSPTATDDANNTTTVGDITGGSSSRVIGATPVASFAAYETAMTDMVLCMQSAGAAITEPVLNGSTGQFEFDFDDANSPTFDRCDDTLAVVEARYLDAGAEIPLDQANLAGDWSTVPADSWLHVLASIPETANTRWAPITVIDLQRAAITLEVDRPGPNAGDRAVFDYLGELASGAGIVPSGPLAAFGRSAFPDQLRAELGFDHRNIDRLASAGIGAREIVVAVGDFEEAAIFEAVTNDPYWSDALSTSTYRDATIHSWGIDFDLDFERFSPTRSVGHNRRLAIEAGRIGWARWTSGVENVVDTIQGNTRSLADVNDLADLAAVADAESLLTGVISPSVSAFVVNLSDQRRAENLLQRPDALMLGDGIDGQGRFTLIALRYNNTTTAAAELSVFEARMVSVAGLAREGDVLRRLVTPRPVETRQTGPTLIAKIWVTSDASDDPRDALLPTASDLIAFA